MKNRKPDAMFILALFVIVSVVLTTGAQAM